MSSVALTETGGTYTYDFSTAGGQAFGGTTGHKEISTGIWGMAGGDGNADGQVNADDKTDWETQVGTHGYKSTDFDVNSEVDNKDKNDIWLINTGMDCQVPDEIVFTCGGVFVDPRDGQTYNTVQIGGECWMAENLNIGAMIIGSENMSDDGIIEKYCYDNDPANCDEYGGLYQWNEMMEYTTTPGVQGICPSGWHLPTKEEWIILINCLGGQVIAGGKMKEAGTTHWMPPNTSATNEGGFTALPGGCRNIDGFFQDIQVQAFFWSSSENNISASWYRSLIYSSNGIFRDDNVISKGFSVRCVKDED